MATAPAGTAESWARHIIDFDAAEPSTYSPHTLPMPEVMRAPARSPIPWPKGTEPAPAPIHPRSLPDDALPQFDYLVVTWTAEEAKCLADTLNAGLSQQDGMV